jgi:hypothetical protein
MSENNLAGTFIILTFFYFSEKNDCASIYGHRGKIQRCSASALRVWFLPVSFAGISPLSPERRPKTKHMRILFFLHPPRFLFSRTSCPAFFMTLFIDGNTRPFKARASATVDAFRKVREQH